MNPRTYHPSRAWHGNHQRITSDNITLIPASQLLFKDEWARVAHSLPAREVLIVLPAAKTPLQEVARAIVPQLLAKGRHLTATQHG